MCLCVPVRVRVRVEQLLARNKRQRKESVYGSSSSSLFVLVSFVVRPESHRASAGAGRSVVNKKAEAESRQGFNETVIGFMNREGY